MKDKSFCIEFHTMDMSEIRNEVKSHKIIAFNKEMRLNWSACEKANTSKHTVEERVFIKQIFEERVSITQRDSVY